MLGRAPERLSQVAHVSLAIEDGQSLTFPEEQLDAVLCAVGLMLSLIQRVACRSSAASCVKGGGPPSRSILCRSERSSHGLMPSSADMHRNMRRSVLTGCACECGTSYCSDAAGGRVFG